MWNGMGDGGGWWHGGSLLLMFIFWGAMILAIALLVRWLFGLGSGPGAAEKSAIQVLKERYARGEIGKDEFEQKKRDLEG